MVNVNGFLALNNYTVGVGKGVRHLSMLLSREVEIHRPFPYEALNPLASVTLHLHHPFAGRASVVLELFRPRLNRRIASSSCFYTLG